MCTVKLTSYISTTTIALNVADSDIYNIEPFNINLSILPCPLGLVLNSSSGSCACDDRTTSVSGVICNISWMPHPIQRSGNNWLSHQYQHNNCIIAHSGCPFDYCNTSCIKFNLRE